MTLRVSRFIFMLGLVAALAPAGASPVDDPADTSLSAQGDADRGRKIFFRCKSCHKLNASAQSLMGPNLNDLFGRRAGAAEGFDRYSRALSEADFTWTEGRLDEWLTNPRTFLPGNKMAFQGLRQASDRHDLLAYLRAMQSDNRDD